MLITEVSIIAKASFNFCQVAVSENVTFHPFFYSLYNSSHPVWLLAAPIWCLCRAGVQHNYIWKKKQHGLCNDVMVLLFLLRGWGVLVLLPLLFLCIFHYSQQRWHIVYHAWCHFIYQSQEIFWLLGINCSVISRCKKKGNLQDCTLISLYCSAMIKLTLSVITLKQVMDQLHHVHS